jgi:hypothetical protein
MQIPRLPWNPKRRNGCSGRRILHGPDFIQLEKNGRRRSARRIIRATGSETMKKITGKLILAIIVLATGLAACVLPAPVQPTLFPFSSPNLTISALFQNPLTPSAKPSPQSGGTVPSTPSATISPTAPDCTNLAMFVSETIPDATVILPGAAFMKTWTLKNTGTCTWGRGYALAFDHGDPMGAAVSIPLTASVPPGALYTFSANLTAPAAAGDYQGFWKIQTPQGLRFGIDPDGTKFMWVKITVASPNACAPQNLRPSENAVPVSAYFTSTPPTIDGALAEWTNSLGYSVPNLVFGKSENKARYGLLWDKTYLYLAVKVADNQFVQETSGGANLYKGDSVEILLDTDLKGDYCDSVMNADDYQLGISPGYLQNRSLTGPSAYFWYPSGKMGGKSFSIAANFTSAPDPAGWMLEARIPWSLFGVSPVGGETYGFVFSVSDDDHPATAQQDGLISTAAKRSTPFNPMEWGSLEISF